MAFENVKAEFKQAIETAEVLPNGSYQLKREYWDMVRGLVKAGFELELWFCDTAKTCKRPYCPIGHIPLEDTIAILSKNIDPDLL